MTGISACSVEAPADKIAAWRAQDAEAQVYQLDPPPSDPDDEKLDGIPLSGALEALAWIDAQQKRVGQRNRLRAGAERSRSRRCRRSRPLPVVTAAKTGQRRRSRRQHPPEVVARANATCGKESIDAEHVKTVRLGGGPVAATGSSAANTAAPPA